MEKNNSVPEDIMIEILVRLPVKSLNRFICVRKSWHYLIKSNTFIHKHFCHKNPNNKEHLLVQHCDDFNERCVFNFLSDNLARTVDRDFYHEAPMNTYVSGPCNGIFCLYQVVCAAGVLWNPANREIRTLPAFRYYDGPPNVRSCWFCLQLGWDPKINDYRIVMFTERWTRVDEMSKDLISQHVAVYSLNNDSWRHFEDKVPFYDICSFDYNYKCLDGVFYWVQLKHKTGKLLSFNVSDEHFKEISGPSFLLGSSHSTTQLAIYNDCIALIHSESYCMDYERCFDIWALVEGYWNKMLMLGPIARIRWPLGFKKHGEIFFEHGDSCGYDYYDVVLYDPQSQQFKDLGINGYRLQILTYKESLVSVNRVCHHQAENFLEVVKSGYPLPEDFSDVIPVSEFFALIHNF